MERKLIAIVPAAGIGKRFGTSIRKTFVNLDGTPLLVHTLKRLHTSEAVKEIIPVLGEQDIGKGYELVNTHGLGKIKKIVGGGKERQDSVFNALIHIEGESLILIHDGVRPIFSVQLVERLIQELDGFDGVAPGIPVKDTLKVVAADGRVISTARREEFRIIQTPQLFPLNILKKAYESAYSDGHYATDDAALVERIGGRVKIIAGSSFNIKITTPEDLEMVEYLLKTEKLQVKS